MSVFVQVQYAMMEYAESVTDVIARRTRVAFLNTHSAREAIPRVAEIMSKQLKWSNQRKAVSRLTRSHFSQPNS